MMPVDSSAADSDAEMDAGPRVPGPSEWQAPVPLAFLAGGHPYMLELNDGTVLKIGGDDNSDSLNFAQEKYDTASRAWTRIEDFPSNSSIPTGSPGVVLDNGTLLMAGGCRMLLTARLPDDLSWGNSYVVDATGTITEVTAISAPRGFHGPARLPSGDVLVTGGAAIAIRDDPFEVLSSTEIYSPTTDAWTAGPEMSVARFQHRAVALASGDILLIGGRDQAGTSLAVVERYDADTGQLVPAASMTTGRAAFAAARLPSGRVLVAGGHTTAEATTALVEIYDPLADRWEPGPTLPTPVAFAVITTLPNGAPLLVGGYETFPDPLGQAMVFDESAGGWASMGELAKARFDPGVLVLSSRRVLVVGGLAGILDELDTSEESDGPFEM